MVTQQSGPRNEKMKEEKQKLPFSTQDSKMETPGIDPGTSRMQSERSSI
jgi:hypothetical protein